MHFQGERLLNGVQEDDYQITVGSGICEIEHLSQNQGHCFPPPLEVAAAHGTQMIKGGLQVLVSIFNLKWIHNLWGADHRPFSFYTFVQKVHCMCNV